MKWVSVEEKLPKKAKDILAYDEEFENIELVYYDGTHWYPAWADTVITSITHWMELPDPPGVRGDP